MTYFSGARDAGVYYKAAVRIATTADIGLSGLAAIDGVTPVAGDRILVKDQSDGYENGIYLAASGSWTRAIDADQDAEVKSGLLVYISEGTLSGGKFYVLSTLNPIVVGTTSLSFVEIGADELPGGSSGQLQYNNSGEFAGLSGSSVSGSNLTLGGSLTVNTLGAGVVHSSAGGLFSSSAVVLTSEVSGVLPVANGGTNSSTALSGNSIMVSNGSAIVQGNTGTSTQVLHGDLTFGAVSLTADVAGTLPVGNGGTGATSFTSGALIFGNGSSALSTDATKLFWDNTNDRLGIGTNSPSSALHVQGDARVTGNLMVDGYTITIASENVLIADNHLYLNNLYTTASAQTGGLVVNYLPTATATTVNGAYTAGVLATSNPTVVTTGSGTFTIGDLIQISGGSLNSGLYEVLSHSGTTLTVRGVGTTACVTDFTQNQFTSGSSDGAAITKVNVSILRAGTDGLWEMAAGSSTTGLTFSDIGTGGGTVTGTGATGRIAYWSGTSALTSTAGFTFDAGTGIMGLEPASGTSQLNITSANDYATLAVTASDDGYEALVSTVAGTAYLNITTLGDTVAGTVMGETAAGASTLISDGGMLLIGTQASNSIALGTNNDVRWKILAAGTLEAQGNYDFVPLTTNNGSVGTVSKQWASVYATNATFASSLTVNGNTTLGDAAGDTLTINGTAVSVPNNLNFDSNTLFIDAANNRIGIGNAAPGNSLHVTGDARITTNLQVDGNVTLGDASGDSVTVNSGTISLVNATNVSLGGTLNIDSNTLVVDASNNRVGIGTATANEALTVSGVLSIAEGSAPSLTSGFGKFYVSSSDSRPYFLTDGGQAHYLTFDGYGALSWSATTNLDLSPSLPIYRSLLLDGNTTLTTSNRGDGRGLTLRLIGGASSYTLTWPAGWNWVGSAAPSSLAAGDTAILAIVAYGSADTDVVAAWSYENAPTSLTGSGSSGAVAFWNGTYTLTQDASNLFWNDTSNRLGIGTATPDAALHVVGVIHATSNAVVDGYLSVAGNTTLGDASGDSITFNAATWSIANATNVSLGGTLNFDSNTVVIDASNNRLGVNTASPGNALHVVGDARITTTLQVDGNTTLGDAAGDTLTINGTAVSVPNNLNFDSNTLFIDAANNRIGIGNAAPGNALHVTGDGRFTTNLQVDGNTTLGDAAGDTLTINGTAVSVPNNLNFDSNTLFIDATNDRVGIGQGTPTSKLHVSGSLATAITTVSANTTLDATYFTVKVDASGAARTITLPAASGCAGRVYVIKKIDSSANNVTIDGNASETIDGSLTQVIGSQYDVLTIQSDGTEWSII